MRVVIESTSASVASRQNDMLSYLVSLHDPRREAILSFYQEHSTEIHRSRGSQTKHQAWTGGYHDHIVECFDIAQTMYKAFTSSGRELPFTLDSAFIVLFFHDVEKIWKYTTGLPPNFDKDAYYDDILPNRYQIVFSADERNALRYVHGEPDSEYNATTRLAGPIAAFCHSVDIMSARLWFDRGRHST